MNHTTSYFLAAILISAGNAAELPQQPVDKANKSNAALLEAGRFGQFLAHILSLGKGVPAVEILKSTEGTYVNVFTEGRKPIASIVVTDFPTSAHAQIALYVQRAHSATGPLRKVRDKYIGDEGYGSNAADLPEDTRIIAGGKKPSQGGWVKLRLGSRLAVVSSSAVSFAELESFAKHAVMDISKLPVAGANEAEANYRNALKIDKRLTDQIDIAASSKDDLKKQLFAEFDVLSQIFKVLRERDRLKPGEAIPLKTLLEFVPDGLSVKRSGKDLLGNEYARAWRVDPHFVPFSEKTMGELKIQIPQGEHLW